MIYLDNNATTQVAPEVFTAMEPYLKDSYGNPSSAHALGRKTRSAVENARAQVAELLGASDASEIVFTSCGSESDNWAIGGFLEQNPNKRHLITTRVEHEAVRNLCEHLAQIGPFVHGAQALIDVGDMADRLHPLSHILEAGAEVHVLVVKSFGIKMIENVYFHGGQPYHMNI